MHIPVSLDLEQLREQLRQTSSLTSTATRNIAKQFLDMNSAITDTVVGGAARMALGVAGKAALVVGSFKLMSAAIEGARGQLKTMVDLADKSQNVGVAPAFFQGFTSEANKLKVSASDLETALEHAFNATNEKSPIDIGEWDFAGQKITDVEKELQVLNATMEKGQRLEGLVLFRDAKTQEDRIQAVLKAMIQLQSIGQQAAAYDLGEKMFGSQLIDRMRQGKTSADSMLATIKEAAANSDGIFSNVLVQRAEEMDQQLQLAHQRLSTALKPSWDDLASVLLTIKGYWAETVDLIAKAVEWSNKLGLTSETARKRNELAAINDAIKNGTALGGLPQVTNIPGMASIYDALGAEKPQDALRRRRDQLQAEIDASERGVPEGPEAPTSRGTGPAPTKISAGSNVDKLGTAADNIEKRTAALNAEARSLDLSTAAREKNKIAAQLQEVAMQANAAAGKGEGVVTDEQRRRIGEVTEAYGKATQAMEKASVALSVRRGSQTALLAPQDVQIAEQLRGLYPDVATALNSVEAQAMRTNEAMRSIGNTMSSSLTSGLADILDGTKSVSDGFASMAKSIVRAIEEAAIKMLIVQPLMRGLSGGLGFADGGIIPKFADGGEITGPGGPRDDGVLARVSPGEFIVNAASTAKHRALLEQINRAPRFADGGMVGGGTAPMFGGQGGNFIMGDIHVNGGVSNGSPADNRALAQQIAQQVQIAAKQMIGGELRTQMRPGGMLKR
ncbi:phage tail tape measure protein [Bradyrhizobium sp. cf659]|uniref:phage tail tape measure protein n=1 Tax=Bradyrhizobium sp. cf659 TaxID=1761771 RepID=UPI0008F2808E|nr:phage tail tape measure protein [Bradyrhizobium sp. cf659]SFH83745.1 hypothetical protein SAMN04487925_101716 [Bradyrhizobium sp. cf659]